MVKQMDKAQYSVYCHTNKANNKKYIGITGIRPKGRWQGGYGYRNCLAFYPAIKKYGWDGFTHEVLFENLTKEEAAQKEIELIKTLQTTDRKYGYNISKGGNTLSDHAKQILSEIHKGAGNHCYGKPCSENVLKVISKPVMCMETGEIYKSVSEAHRITGINLGHIASVCRGERKSAGGHKWAFAVEVENES